MRWNDVEWEGNRVPEGEVPRGSLKNRFFGADAFAILERSEAGISKNRIEWEELYGVVGCSQQDWRDRALSDKRVRLPGADPSTSSG
jgi:hypothetical protein